MQAFLKERRLFKSQDSKRNTESWWGPSEPYKHLPPGCPWPTGHKIRYLPFKSVSSRLNCKVVKRAVINQTIGIIENMLSRRSVTYNFTTLPPDKSLFEHMLIKQAFPILFYNGANMRRNVEFVLEKSNSISIHKTYKFWTFN